MYTYTSNEVSYMSRVRGVNTFARKINVILIQKNSLLYSKTLVQCKNTTPHVFFYFLLPAFIII